VAYSADNRSIDPLIDFDLFQRGAMAIPWTPVPEGTRVKIKRGMFPQDPAFLGRTGVVVNASEYQTQNVGVSLDGTTEVRFFTPDELEVTEEAALPPDRESAKRRRSLP
jgi:hypothetical protein